MEFWAEIFNKFALGFVAIISMIVGPIVQWRIAKRQSDNQAAIAKRQVADSIAGKRLAWIGEVRSDIAGVIADYTTYFELHYFLVKLASSDEEKWEKVMEMKEIVKHAAFLITQIDLRLTGSDPDHFKLMKSLGLLRDFVSGHGPMNDFLDANQMATWNSLRTQVLADGKKLLNAEWSRIRLGEV